MEESLVRSRVRNNQPITSGPVLYWMGRDQRIDDNWALIEAYNAAEDRAVPLQVVFNLPASYGKGTLRQYDFLLKGLQEVEQRCAELNITFHLLEGDVVTNILTLVREERIGQLFADFNPLRVTRGWHEEVYQKVGVQAVEVDAHNIVPCWIASPKEEFAAYTFRPKITKLIPSFLIEFPALKPVSTLARKGKSVDWKAVYEQLKVDATVAPVAWLKPGAQAAMETLKSFVDTKLIGYAEGRNDPNQGAVSQLSPYLHFGHISAQRVALSVQKSSLPSSAKEAFLEELIVRKELSDNYCYYNPHYDVIAGAHTWAQKTIAEHADDPREYVCTCSQLESGNTHDELWNAMQMQMVQEGKMHGWCRMYWAKKIMEWTPDVQTAIDIALYLNDRYELDGNDPNGYVGVMWSIAGVHDRAWTERPIFGKIRYMNFNGAKRKFDVPAFIKKYDHTKTLFAE